MTKLQVCCVIYCAYPWLSLCVEYLGHVVRRRRRISKRKVIGLGTHLLRNEGGRRESLDRAAKLRKQPILVPISSLARKPGQKVSLTHEGYAVARAGDQMGVYSYIVFVAARRSSDTTVKSCPNQMAKSLRIVAPEVEAQRSSAATTATQADVRSIECDVLRRNRRSTSSSQLQRLPIGLIILDLGLPPSILLTMPTSYYQTFKHLEK